MTTGPHVNTTFDVPAIRKRFEGIERGISDLQNNRPSIPQRLSQMSDGGPLGLAQDQQVPAYNQETGEWTPTTVEITSISRTFNVPNTGIVFSTSGTINDYSIPPQDFPFMFQATDTALLAGGTDGDIVELAIFYGFDLLAAQQQTVQSGIVSFSLTTPWFEVSSGTPAAILVTVDDLTGGLLTLSADAARNFLSGLWVPA